jgi:hypothetical protein
MSTQRHMLSRDTFKHNRNNYKLVSLFCLFLKREMQFYFLTFACILYNSDIVLYNVAGSSAQRLAACPGIRDK